MKHRMLDGRRYFIRLDKVTCDNIEGLNNRSLTDLRAGHCILLERFLHSRVYIADHFRYYSRSQI